MSYDLTSQSGATAHFSVFEWSRLLWLAERHGWVPQHPDKNWSSIGFGVLSYYIGNNNQRVGEQDALALADALKDATRFLGRTGKVAGALPERLTDPFEKNFANLAAQEEALLACLPERYFGEGDHRKCVQHLIDFIKENGGFEVG